MTEPVKSPELQGLELTRDMLAESVEKRKSLLSSASEATRSAYKATIEEEDRRLSEVNARISELSKHAKK